MLAGDRRLEDARIGAGEGAFKLFVLGTYDITEVSRDFEQQVHVEPRVVLGALEDFDQRSRSGSGWDPSTSRKSRCRSTGTGFDGLDQGGDGHAETVEWECTCTGRSTAFLIALTRS